MKHVIIVLIITVIPTLLFAQELEFGITFKFSDGLDFTDLTVGVSPNGSGGELDQLAPPPPPDGVFYAHMKVNGSSYITKYFDNNLSTKELSFEFDSSFYSDYSNSDDNYNRRPVTMTWDHVALNILGTFTITYFSSNGYQDVHLNDLDGNFTIFPANSDSSILEFTSFYLDFTPSGNNLEITETPIFSPNGGTFQARSIEVSIDCATEGATIYYTTDGSDPTIYSTPYTGTFTHGFSGTIKAIAAAEGLRISEIAEATFIIQSDLEFTLPFTVSSEVSTEYLTVGVSPDGSDTDFVEGLDEIAPPPPPSGAFMPYLNVNGNNFYTKYFDNGLEPKYVEFYYGSSEGNVTITWDQEILNILGTFTIQSSSFGTGNPFTQSMNNLDGSFTIPITDEPPFEYIQDRFYLVFIPSGNSLEPEQIAEKPVFSPNGGAFEGNAVVTITSETDGASIYYTTDGTDPTLFSAQYTEPITLNASATLKAIAGGDGFQTSEIAEASFTILASDPNLTFTLPINVSDGANTTTLTVGVSPNGSNSTFVDELDQLAQAPPPGGVFDARMRVNGNSYITKYFDNTLAEKTATFEYSASNGNGPITLTWDQEALNMLGIFTIKDIFYLPPDAGGVNVSMNDLDGSYTINSSVIQNSLNLVFTPFDATTDEVNASYSVAWNMVSLPLTQAHSDYTELFPDALDGTLYGFDGTYQQYSTLVAGEGYWVNMSAASDVTFAGSGIESQSVDLDIDWNMIGSVTATATIVDDNSIVLPGTLYGFNGSYNLTSELTPGAGYWVATSAAGSVTISSAAGLSSEAADFRGSLPLNEFHRIVVQSGELHTQELYFGGTIHQELHPLQVTLPPAPPSGSFDARLGGNRWITDTESAFVELMQSQEPVRIHMEGSGTYAISVFSDNKKVAEQKVFAGETIELPMGADGFQVEMTEVGGSETPDTFTLSQNYPNPFNPATSIQFGLPEASDVTLEVYTMLGQKVATLVNESRNAGYHTVNFDASTLSSGMYIYRIQAGSFIQTKKFTLLK